MGVLQTLPRLQAGKAIVELHNEYDKPVTVLGLIFSAGEEQTGTAAILSARISVPAKEGRVVDVTDTLRRFSPGQRDIRIGLNIVPKPPGQPGPANYRIRLEEGRCVAFEKAVQDSAAATEAVL